MPTKHRVKNGTNALKAGRLGEKAVHEILSLREPHVEVKTMQLERHTFSVELTQLERQPDKVYAVCAYSRGKRLRPDAGKTRAYERTIDEAFKHGLTFLLIDTNRLLELVKAGQFKVRWVEKNYRTKARFVALFRLEDCKDSSGTLHHTDGTLHTIYNCPELVNTLHKAANAN